MNKPDFVVHLQNCDNLVIMWEQHLKDSRFSIQADSRQACLSLKQHYMSAGRVLKLDPWVEVRFHKDSGKFQVTPVNDDAKLLFEEYEQWNIQQELMKG